MLSAERVRHIRSRLESAKNAWVDGRATAGHQGRHVKRNLQIAEDSAVARELGDIIVSALERHSLFLSAALPKAIYPPLFNRYDGAEQMHFGAHVDGAVRALGSSGRRIRTDISATLFVSSPEEYDGGELEVRDTYGSHAVKLPAGDLVLYSATSRHHVTPVTRGSRWSSFFWVQSMVQDEAARTMLFELDTAVQGLRKQIGDTEQVVSLTGLYHNLVRRWAQA